PPAPTVGDTIWLERAIAVPAGWQVRAGKLDATEAVEPLADPAVLRRAGGWVVRYAVVVWKPGVHKLGLPPLWRLGPDGRADLTAGGTTSLSVASVIPDSLLRPSPQGLLAPLRAAHRDPVPPLVALALAAGLLATGVVVRRRRPRTLEPAPPVPLEREVPDTRWLAAGEPKAVAERAIWRLRAALVRAVPEAHPALDTAECLAVVERARPDAPLRELRDLLEQLDRVTFASAHGTDVAALRHGASARARAESVSFARPLLLLALGLLPLWWWLRAKRLARLSGTQMSDVRPAAGAAERLWVARLPVTLRSACLGAWIIAAAGPRIGAARSETRSEGISIVLAVDISGSMQAEDFAPANRIDVAKQTAIEFVRARTSDRIGLVAFAAQALTQVPIT